MAKIVICPDSFKESLSSVEVAEAIEIGLKRSNSKLETIKIPLADGGTGSCRAIIYSTNAKPIKKAVSGPTGKKILSTYIALDEKTVFIEMAEAGGLHLIPTKERNPLITTTFGVGELIKDALKRGFKKIIVGIGGSGTNDGGVGMAMALGIKFYDKNNKKIGLGGKELIKIKKIDITNLDEKAREAEFIVASDVENPLLGEHGATMVYGPQKGAKGRDLKILEEGMRNLAKCIKKYLGKNVTEIGGAGAAGGLGAGLIAFLNARIESGVGLISKIIGLEEKIKEGDIVITGEGRIDNQTFYGKTIAGVLKLAKKYRKPVVCICGSVQENLRYEFPIVGVFSIINSPMDFEEAKLRSQELIVDCAFSVGKFISYFYRQL